MKAIIMVTRVLNHPASALVAALFILPLAVHSAEIRVMCYQDGVECDVVAEQAKRFEAQNAGTKVVIDVCLLYTSDAADE